MQSVNLRVLGLIKIIQRSKSILLTVDRCRHLYFILFYFILLLFCRCCCFLIVFFFFFFFFLFCSQDIRIIKQMSSLSGILAAVLKTYYVTEYSWHRLMLSTLNKNFSRRHFEFFSYQFLPENRFLHFMQIVSFVDHSHELQKPFPGKSKLKYHQSVVCWLGQDNGKG